MVKDQWMTSAMADDALVVQLLLRLKQSQASPSNLLTPISWGLRQPRSRSFPSFRCAALSNLDSTRCSPSTPLSYTRLHSSSPASDASDDSTHPTNLSSRSKDASAAGNYSAIKSCRKRKSSEELEREGLLCSDDRVHWEKESSVALRGTYREHSANNESFKRTKINLNLQSSSELTCTLGQRQKGCRRETKGGVGAGSMSQSLQMHEGVDDDEQRKGSDVYEEEEGKQESHMAGEDFLLPDLNMMPSDMEKYDCV